MRRRHDRRDGWHASVFDKGAGEAAAVIEPRRRLAPPSRPGIAPGTTREKELQP